MAQPYTEHTLKLPDGVEIRYTDSGAPQTVDYTTLVVIHGTGFNGYCFLKLHELAHKYNLRIAIMNRRDYHGSTMFSDEDLADMHAGRRIFQDRLATQVAWFLQHFIEHESTPTVSADRTSGGFLLMGWSSGCSVALAPFADRDVLPSALYDAVEPYLRSLVLYDPPVHTLGYLPPAGTGYDPFKDPECTNPDMLFKMFQLWTASYFSHPDIASGAPQGISVEKYTPKRTTKDWTEEQMARCFEKAAAARSALPAGSPMRTTLAAQTRNALFDAVLAASHFPRVNVFYITGEQTVSTCIYAYMENTQRHAETPGRSITFKLVPGGNHFLHYDAPELFLSEVVAGCAQK